MTSMKKKSRKDTTAVASVLAFLLVLLGGCTVDEQKTPDRIPIPSATSASASICGIDKQLPIENMLTHFDIWKNLGDGIESSSRYLILDEAGCAIPSRSVLRPEHCEEFPWVSDLVAQNAELYTLGARSWANVTWRKRGTDQVVREQILRFDPTSTFAGEHRQAATQCGAKVVTEESGRASHLLLNSKSGQRLLTIEDTYVISIDVEGRGFDENALIRLGDLANRKAPLRPLATPHKSR